MSAKLFWLDLETTGLDPEKCSILEVAAVVTDGNLDFVEQFSDVVHASDEELAKMDEWCTKTHSASGLVEGVRASTNTLAQIELELIALVKRHFAPGENVVLAGNTVGFDRSFVKKYMPTFAKLLHYRTLDVSSLKVYFQARYGAEVPKKNAHRAMPDIIESIAELNYYGTFVTYDKKK